ncbi:MAG: heme ABC exporter ATP-binding protein CcmA [Calditrichia bacterium]
MWQIIGNDLQHQFNRRVIFRGISFKIESGQSLVLIGPNGSGKSTLIRIICRLLRPSGGSVRFFNNDKEVLQDQLYPHIGLVAPYLQLYNNLTAYENYQFFARIRGQRIDLSHFRNWMEQLGLKGREMDELRTYSSGMLQRMKYVMALIHQPEILILDEPSANLDDEGREIVGEIMRKQKQEKILILASNEPEEFQFGDKQISIVS